MNLPYKSAAEALNESPLAGLVDRARLLGRLSSAIADLNRQAFAGADLAPPPSCALQGRFLIISVGSPSQAAKLRQHSAELDRLMRNTAPDLSGFRIRLQPGRSAGAEPPTAPATAPATEAAPTDLAAALRFAEELSRDLPDSPLRRSAQRLQASLRRRLAGR